MVAEMLLQASPIIGTNTWSNFWEYVRGPTILIEDAGGISSGQQFSVGINTKNNNFGVLVGPPVGKLYVLIIYNFYQRVYLGFFYMNIDIFVY